MRWVRPWGCEVFLRRILSCLPLCLLIAGSYTLHAQSGLDIHIGASGANAKSTGESLDIFGEGNFRNTPSLDGVFMNIGGGIMLSPRFGVGAEVSFKPQQSD